MQVYLTKDGAPQGPFSVGQLRQYMETGHCKVTDYACHDGTNWVTIADVPGIAKKAQRLTDVDAPETKSRKKLYLIVGIVTVIALSISCVLYFVFTTNTESGAASASQIATNGNIFTLTPEEIVSIYDGDTFVLGDGISAPVTFEFDSGFLLKLPTDGGKTIPDSNRPNPQGIKDGDYFTLTNGSVTVTFEFDKDQVPTIRPGNVRIPQSNGSKIEEASTALGIAKEIVAAINASPVSGVDVAPTFFSFAGIDLPWEMHGRDLTPLLKKPEQAKKRSVLTVFTGRKYGSDTDAIPTDLKELRKVAEVPWYASLHDGRYKYVRTFEKDEIEEMYDLREDPEELTNLALLKKHGARLAKMRGQTIAELKRTKAGFVDNLPSTGTDKRTKGD